MKKIRHSFAVYKNSKGEMIGKVLEAAKLIAENWGNVPRSINDLRAQEIHMICQDYVRLRKLRDKK